MTAVDYADILNDLGMNDDKSDDSTQKEPVNDNNMKDENPKRNVHVLHRRLSAQKSLVEELRQKEDMLAKKLKLSQQNNRLLKDQLEEFHTIVKVEQNEILTENLQLKTKCKEWKVKYENEQQDIQRLKDEIKQLEEENEQFKMKSLHDSKWKEWTSNDVYLYLMSIDDGFLKSYQYEIKTFINDSQIKGADLPAFTMNDWKDCGINKFADRVNVIKVIKLLTDATVFSYNKGENRTEEIDSKFKYFKPSTTDLSQNINNNTTWNKPDENRRLSLKQSICENNDIEDSTNQIKIASTDTNNREKNVQKQNIEKQFEVNHKSISNESNSIVFVPKKKQISHSMFDTNKTETKVEQIEFKHQSITNVYSENDTTALENEIIRNEKQYQILLNDTSILEAEIIRNEQLWRKYIITCTENSENNQSSQPQSGKHKNDENDDNKNDYDGDNNHNNDNDNNNENNNSGGDEKKDEDKDKNDKNKNKDDDENKSYDISKLKEKMKLVKANTIYKRIQNSVKYALNENELMAIIYYCDSESACSKMKKAHRCIIKDLYWQETYYHCTHSIEKIYKVLHYNNKQFKLKYDMAQKLYHGSQEIQLNGYDKDQFFFKTITSFSTNNSIAEGFTKNIGFIFIIDKAFEGLYNGELRGANVEWLSNFNEYEYVILPTTYNHIKEYIDHGLSVNAMQNVYITSDYKTNNDTLKPHSDTVSTMMQISYAQFDTINDQKQNTNNNYSQQLERKYESDYSIRELERIRDMKLCHIINCDFENADTIPSQQLDTRVFDEAELQHIYQCHPYFYLRLTIWTKTTENDMNKNTQWDDKPLYFMQITYVDSDLFNLRVTCNKMSDKTEKLFIKDINENNSIGNKFYEVIRIKHSESIFIRIDEKHNGLHLLGLYENKHAKISISNSNTIRVMLETDDSKIPPKMLTTYEVKCINLETLRFVKDDKNEKVNVYWDAPLETYGEISYKILNHINETERETISILPYSIQFYYAFLPFKVCTIVSIDEKVYESMPSQSIYICRSDHEND